MNHDHGHGTLDCPACLWSELQAGWMLDAPRLEPRFWACPVCFLAASDAANIGGTTWAYCRDCLVRWIVDGPLAMLAPCGDAFTELFVEALHLCIELEPRPDALTSATPSIDTEDPVLARRQHTLAFDLDLRAFQPPREHPILYGMIPARRVAVTQLVVQHVVAACDPHPVSGRPILNDHRLWSAIRYLHCDDAETTVERALREAEITSPVAELGRVAALLLGLRERRAFLAKQLELLDEIETAFEESEDGGA